MSQRMVWGRNSPAVPYKKCLCTVNSQFYPTYRVLPGAEDVTPGKKKKVLGSWFLLHCTGMSLVRGGSVSWG